MTRLDGRSSPCPEAAAMITRVWRPADGPDRLADILREVIASGGTLTARIPAIALTPEQLIAAGARQAKRERVA
jgi:hypothetical protein